MAGQNPFFSFIWGSQGKSGAATLAGKLAPAVLDPSGLLASTIGGLNWTQFNAAAVIKASPGRAVKLVVVTAGSAGAWTFNDCATTAAAATANQIASIAYNATGLTAGMPITFDWPCATGIVVSAVPTGGVANLSWA